MNDRKHLTLQQLLDSNKSWRERLLADDESAFAKFADGQQPPFFWIGCSDSRVPISHLTGLDRGDAFVQRNIANQVKLSDTSIQAALAFAVEVLGVEHVVVCGHYGCGGVQLAAELDDAQQVDHKLRQWVASLHSLCQQHSGSLSSLEGEAKLRKLSELNVGKQVDNVCLHPAVQARWARGESLGVHGLIYDINDGSLHNLNISRNA
ncbi:MAG: carbonic anhydrase [Gammaproteobacteria bacterium]|nr:carbonic anhydrase [Gammaproteobacteria bacterium]NND38615.1 carbonic anhydrase [Pseudomonadales bacterium]NNL10693.1 carbonic anhydrase [Pseudomonadales bacterium]NNM11336.1 carbonic anhydrase [Pseudomonadales bacterium]